MTHPDTLKWAWVRVKRNHGAPGVDGMDFGDIEQADGGVEYFLKALQEELTGKRYKAQAVRRVGAGNRALGRWIKGWGEDASGELYVLSSRILGPSGATGRMQKLVPAPETVKIAAISQPTAGNVHINWTGGTGPFAVQRSPDLAQPFWTDATLTDSTNQTFTTGGQAGFLRTLDTAHLSAIPLSVYLTGATPATGLGLFSLDGNTLTFSLSYTGLSGSPDNAHIWQAPTSALRSTRLRSDWAFTRLSATS